MNHTRLHLATEGTTQSCNPSIQNILRKCLTIGKFTMMMAILLLGNVDLTAQCDAPVSEALAHCSHPADGAPAMLLGDDPTTVGPDYVDVDADGIEDTADGAYVDLSTATCSGQLFSGTVLSGATYGFNLTTGQTYTFEVCGVNNDIYPLMDLWLNLAAPAVGALELAALSDEPAGSTTCTKLTYTPDTGNEEVFLNVLSQVHGLTCSPDWKSWTLTVACEGCKITCAPDVNVSANADGLTTCEAETVIATTPKISDGCDVTTLMVLASSTLPDITADAVVAEDTPLTYDNGGAGYTVGAYTIVYQVEDCAGNTSTCTQNIIVEPVMACNDNVNITLGSNCATTITPDMILEAPCADESNYTVTVVGLTTNTVEAPGTYTVRVEYAPGGNPSGLYCWGEITVEDKTGPTCTLEEDQYTGFCGSVVDTEVPVFSDCTGLATGQTTYDISVGECGTYDGVAIDLMNDTGGDGYIDAFVPDHFIPFPDNNLTASGFALDNIVIRTWQMADALGNGSASCQAYIYYWRPSTVLEPVNLVEVECLSNLTAETLATIDPQYVPHFDNPDFNGLGAVNPAVYPLTELDADGDPKYLPILGDGHTFCKYSVTSNDVPLLDLCGQTEKMIREWTVLNWCSGAVLMNQVPQVIKTVDTTAPVWANCPTATEQGGSVDNPLTLSTSTSSACYFYGVLTHPTATDVCGNVTYTARVNNTNGGLVRTVDDLQLPVQIDGGVYEVEYIATDDCGNSTSCSYYYNVLDDDQPVAICDQFTTISLTNAIGGTARICADNLDSGSYDNCGIVTMKIRRMNNEAIPTAEFTDCLDLTCEDAVNSPIMVVLRVMDEAGNFNECMVEVEIQDKIGPFLTCPPDVTITCTDDLYDFSLTGTVEENQTSTTNPLNGYAWDNCNLGPVTYDTNVSTLTCGAGVATRTWTASSNGTVETCTQTITISPINSFRVKFPEDVTITSCVDPDNLGDFGQPEILDDICAQVGISTSELRFDVVSGACYKILRTFTVINWCNYDDQDLTNTALGNLVEGTTHTFDDDGDGYFRYTQVIKVQDSTKPVFTTCPADTVVFVSETATCGGEVDLLVEATDDCTGLNDISYEYFIDIDNDGVNELSGTGNRVNDGTEYPFGTHRVVFIAEDGCGNTARCDYLFRVEDGYEPNVACKGLSVTLMPSSNSIEMWASDYIKQESGLSDNCTSVDELVISIIRQSDSDQVTPPATTNITFNCQDLITDKDGDGTLDTLASNTIPVEIWVVDEAGNSTYCTAMTTIATNNNGCFPNAGSGSGTGGGDDNGDGSKAIIAGSIVNEAGDMVEAVNVEVNSTDGIWGHVTGTDGHYEIGELPMHDNYIVQPENDINPLNGVTTYDLVLMSQHILGFNEIDSPYKMIAADVNNNGTITTADVVELRQMILYITTDFQNNKSWRFVDANFVFPDATNPFAVAFPEVRSLNDLDSDAMTENFVGVKIGDLNGDAVANTLLGAEERNLAGTFTMSANDQLVAAGEELSFTLNTEDMSNVNGFQFTLEFDPSKLEFAAVGETDLAGLSATNFGYSFVKEGMLTASWNKVADATATSQSIELIFTAKEDVQLSEAISLSSRYTKAEAYTASLENMDVSLQFNTSNGTILADANFELYQNQPNPFRNETSIGFTLPEATTVTLTIFDVEGKELKVYSNEYAKGYNQFTIGNDDLTSGIVYYRLDTPTHSATKKMIVIK